LNLIISIKIKNKWAWVRRIRAIPASRIDNIPKPSSTIRDIWNRNTMITKKPGSTWVSATPSWIIPKKAFRQQKQPNKLIGPMLSVTIDWPMSTKESRERSMMSWPMLFSSRNMQTKAKKMKRKKCINWSCNTKSIWIWRSTRKRKINLCQISSRSVRNWGKMNR